MLKFICLCMVDFNLYFELVAEILAASEIVCHYHLEDNILEQSPAIGSCPAERFENSIAVVIVLKNE